MEINFVLIGKRIKEIRKMKGLSQVVLAGMLDCDPCYVSKLETGSKNASIARLIAIADCLDVSVDQLLGRTVPENSHDELDALLGDCTPQERRLMIGALRGLKQVLREGKDSSKT